MKNEMRDERTRTPSAFSLRSQLDDEASGDIPSVRIGRSRRVRSSDLDDWVAGLEIVR
jgi:hypothetical protein